MMHYHTYTHTQTHRHTYRYTRVKVDHTHIAHGVRRNLGQCTTHESRIVELVASERKHKAQIVLYT